MQESLKQFAQTMADAASEIIAENYRGQFGVERKTDSTPVTEIDRRIESVLRDLVASSFPSHGVRGEEFPDRRGEGEYLWVLDPIDGTKAFVTGNPLFGTLIALLRDAVPILGVLDVPVLAERWIGGFGEPTTLNGVPCSTSTERTLARATLYASSPDMFLGDHWRRFQQLCAQVRFNRYGSDCYAYGLLASGFTELVVEADMHAYDYMALVPVVLSAGGVITDWQGKALGLESDGTVVAAANAELHGAALEALR